MTVDDNIRLAKKLLVENIYRSIRIEGISMTFSETQTVIDGMSVAGHSIDDINAVNDLKNAWYFILNIAAEDIAEPVTVNKLKKLTALWESSRF